MLFSLDFVLLFLPLILLSFFTIKRFIPQCCALYLVALLYVALCAIDVTSCLLVLATSSFNYLIIKRLVADSRKKWLLPFGVTSALLPLAFFKFMPSLLGNSATESSMFFTVGIPMGLSFYALQQVSALLDCSKGKYPPLSYTQHLLYLGFFPNFVAGPVLPYRDGVQQITALGQKPIPESWLGNGLLLFFFGLVKKLWIADPIGGAVDHVYASMQTKQLTLDFYEAWFVVWGFLVQLYFDFSAYSDIAIGLALCFGILLPINFDSPLKSFSTQEYISRWHMSFTQFVQTYLFIPALNIFKKLPIKNTEKRMAFAWAAGLFLSYMVIGIWHSPNLTIMLSSTVVILVIFALKMPSILAGSVQEQREVSRLRKHVNRVTILTFSMLMAASLKIQDLEVILSVYGSLVDIQQLSLPRFVEPVLPAFISNYFTYQGVAPTLDSYHLGTFIFTHKSMYLLLLAMASVLIFVAPNSMQLFGIKGFDKRSDFKLGQGPRFYGLFFLLFCLAVFALVFENHHKTTFIYEYF